MKNILLYFICLLSLGLTNCSISDDEVTQYIAFKEGDKKFTPIAKITYKVFVDRQEVAYWVEVPDYPRSDLYKLKNCIVFDKNNWEGEAEPFLNKVKLINGKFQGADSVSWWTWHFETEPKQTFLSNIYRWGIYILILIGILIPLGILFSLIEKKMLSSKKIKRTEKDVSREIIKFTRAQREEFKKSGYIK